MPEELIEVKDTKEVWWAKTIEYDLVVKGKSISVRIAETPKGTDFYLWDSKGGWDAADTDDELMAIVHEAWCEGQLDY